MYGQGQAYPYPSPAFGGLQLNAMLSMPPPTSQQQQQATRAVAGFGNKDKLSNDTSSKDPELLKARVFIGNLNTAQCTRIDLIDLCQPYGRLKALSLLKGYAFVQYETQTEAEMAIKILSGYSFFNQKLDVRLAAMGKGSVVSANSTTGPIRRPKHDFLFGGQRIRVETTNARNRTFSQEVFGAIKDINFHNHGKDDNIICGSCRTVFTNIKPYVEHRRQKKCNFFEREVAPSIVSCFTCKEEFDEPWLFIQHLIHRHSINLYRDQPDSDPVSYLEKVKAQKEAEKNKSVESTAETNVSEQQQQQPIVDLTESNGTEQRVNTTESNGSNTQMEVIASQEPNKEATPPTTENTSEIPIEPAPINEVDNNLEEAGKTQPPVVVKQEVNEDVANKSPTPTSAADDDIPSYSSAISIGVSSKTTASNPILPTSSIYVPSMGPTPSFHSQMASTFPSQQPLPMPAYQFTQPIISNASQIPANYTSFTSSFAPTSLAPSMFNQPPPAQISLPQFMAQSSTTTSNQGGLSEEEQLRMLQEFDMDNM